MKTNLRKAKVIKTGEIITVYKLKRGTWCNYKDCKTEYQEKELQFLEP